METKLEQIAVKAVNQLPKSVVREIRTPRSVGAGGGRRTPAARGYQYSPALKTSGFAWDQASFAAFMQDPKTKVPGNKMAFAGMKDQAEIASPWTYLARFNADGSSK